MKHWVFKNTPRSPSSGVNSHNLSLGKTCCFRVLLGRFWWFARQPGAPQAAPTEQGAPTVTSSLHQAVVQPLLLGSHVLTLLMNMFSWHYPTAFGAWYEDQVTAVPPGCSTALLQGTFSPGAPSLVPVTNPPLPHH